LVSDYGADGLRLDTAKHVRQSFYPAFLQSAGVFATAEILDGRANYTGDYTNYIDSVLNYPQFYILQQAFGYVGGNMSALVQNFKDTTEYFKNGAMSTVSFSENQDNPRLPSFIKDPVLIKNIITWTFGNDGVPVLYYGQEASYSGTDDPYNREALWFTSYSTEVSLYQYVTYLNKARKLALADSTSNFATTAATIAASTNEHIALSKYPMLTVLTNLGNASATTPWSIPNNGYKAGTQVVDITTCTGYTVANNGSLQVNFVAGAPMVLLPTTVLNSTSVCGSMATKGGSSSSKSGAFRSQAVAGLVALVAGALASFVLL